MADQPNPIDVEVGRRLKRRRTLLGVSQERLGELLGVSYQQIQKYERGANRIGSSRLYDICRILEVPAGFFLDDAPSPCAAPPPPASGLAEEPAGFAFDGPAPPAPSPEPAGARRARDAGAGAGVQPHPRPGGAPAPVRADQGLGRARLSRTDDPGGRGTTPERLDRAYASSFISPAPHLAAAGHRRRTARGTPSPPLRRLLETPDDGRCRLPVHERVRGRRPPRQGLRPHLGRDRRACTSASTRQARVACETLATTNRVVIAGEVRPGPNSRITRRRRSPRPPARRSSADRLRAGGLQLADAARRRLLHEQSADIADGRGRGARARTRVPATRASCSATPAARRPS